MLSGFLLVNKPVGISSYACIGHIKRILRSNPIQATQVTRTRIGHAGTLDPFASGLLIIAIGRESTRLLPQCMAMKKTYVATGKCGELTDTLDCTGTVVITQPTLAIRQSVIENLLERGPHSACNREWGYKTSNIIPSEEDLCKALISFGSSYEQIPPIYSALKHEGKPLYALARKNMLDSQQLHAIADTKRRTVQFYDKHFLSYDAPYFTIQVTVCRGTYIRTLINDIAVRAGSCATTYELTRTAIGPFALADAINLASIQDIDSLNRALINPSMFFNQDY